MTVEDVDLVPLAEHAVSDCAPAALDRQLEVRLITFAAQAVVPGDPIRLGQVLDNLVSNAMKFTPAGGHVDVRIHAGEGSVVAEVCDDGPGIAPEDQLRLFDRLFRTRAVVEANVPGAGLGLSIALGIAEAHGGSLTVDSVVGEGTIFRLTLPTTRGEGIPAQRPAPRDLPRR
jgi:signal transduction histidine kinase